METLGRFLGVIGAVVLFVIILTFPIMLIWNYVFIKFGLPTLNLWETFLMIVFFKTIFSSNSKD